MAFVDLPRKPCSLPLHSGEHTAYSAGSTLLVSCADILMLSLRIGGGGEQRMKKIKHNRKILS